MRTIFKVAGTSELKSRRLFVAFGNIVEGVLHPGMRVALSDGGEPIATIGSIDFIDFRMSKQSYVAITFQPVDGAVLDSWRSSIQEDVLLDCVEPKT
jgi:hypothetical protein